MFNQNITAGPGISSFTNHTIEIIVLLLVAFILGFLIAYLLQKIKYSMLIGQIGELKLKCEEYKKLHEKTINEKNLLKIEVDKYLAQVKDWEVKYQSVINENKKLQLIVDNCSANHIDKSEFSKLQSELGVWQNKLSSSENNAKMLLEEKLQLQNNNSGAFIELQKSYDVVKNQNLQFEELIAKLKLQLNECNNKVTENQKTIEKDTLELKNNLALANEKNQKLQAEIASWQGKVASLEKDSQQLLAINNNNQNTEQQLLELKKNYDFALTSQSQFTNENTDLKNSLTAAYEKIKILESEISQKNQQQSAELEQKNVISKIENEALKYKEQIDLLQAKIGENNQLISDLQREIDRLKAANIDIKQVSNFVASAPLASVAVAKSNLVENLEKVKGIGPKINKLLHEHGVVNFSILAKTSTERLQEILNIGGADFTIHDPSTWAHQGDLIARGKLDEFEEYAHSITAGKIIKHH